MSIEILIDFGVVLSGFISNLV